MLGRLSLAAIPLNESIPLITGLVVILIILAVLAAYHRKGLVALSVARVDNQRRP